MVGTVLDAPPTWNVSVEQTELTAGCEMENDTKSSLRIFEVWTNSWFDGISFDFNSVSGAVMCAPDSLDLPHLTNGPFLLGESCI